MTSSYQQPPYVALESYNDISAIRESFTPLVNINKQQSFDNLEQSLFFVIRTQGEDSVHRAMKYGIWTSSSRKNQKLSEAYKQAQKLGGNVYLFYTEITNNYFTGVAKLVSDFDEKAHFKYWLSENKWFGLFKIEWIFVKDTDFTSYENLKQNQTLDNGTKEVLKPVHDLIDCTELKPELGQQMLDIFAKNNSDQGLFQHFTNLDKVELQCRQQRENDPKFEKKFQELIKVFEQIPFSFSVNSYEKRKLHRKQNQMYIQQFYYSPYMMQQYYPQQYMPYGSQQPPQAQQVQGGLQQPFPQQVQQTNQGNQGPYWYQNNGFYQKQQHHEDKKFHPKREEGEKEKQSPQKQQNPIEEDPTLKNVPLQNRFQVKQKKQKSDKKHKKPQHKYVPKNDYQQDPNFVVPAQQEESEEEQQLVEQPQTQ